MFFFSFFPFFFFLFAAPSWILRRTGEDGGL